MPHMSEAPGNSHFFSRYRCEAVPPSVGGTEPYWGAMYVLWSLNDGPERETQPGLCQSGGNVGYTRHSGHAGHSQVSLRFCDLLPIRKQATSGAFRHRFGDSWAAWRWQEAPGHESEAVSVAALSSVFLIEYVCS